MTNQNNINNKIKQIISKSTIDENNKINSYKDTYYPLAILLSILILIELYLDRREYLWKK